MKVLKIAVWCPGCLVMRSKWEEIEKENPWLKTEYFEYDDCQEEMKSKYGLGDELPIFIFVDEEEKELSRLKGEVSKDKIIEEINKYK